MVSRKSTPARGKNGRFLKSRSGHSTKSSHHSKSSHSKKGKKGVRSFTLHISNASGTHIKTVTHSGASANGAARSYFMAHGSSAPLRIKVGNKHYLVKKNKGSVLPIATLI